MKRSVIAPLQRKSTPGFAHTNGRFSLRGSAGQRDCLMPTSE
jgi:hypothetical protein